MNKRAKIIAASILQGKLLLRIKADKYLPQIVYAFVMATVLIAANIGIENTIHQKEENRRVLENLRSVHTETICQLTSLDSVCQVEDMLRERGSRVAIPTRKARRVE